MIRFRAELDHAQQQLLAETGSTAGVLLSAHTSLSEEMKTIGLGQAASASVDAAAALLAAADALAVPDAPLRAEPEDLRAAAEGGADKEAGVRCTMPLCRQGSLQRRYLPPAELGAMKNSEPLGCSPGCSQEMSGLTSSCVFCLPGALFRGKHPAWQLVLLDMHTLHAHTAALPVTAVMPT